MDDQFISEVTNTPTRQATDALFRDDQPESPEAKQSRAVSSLVDTFNQIANADDDLRGRVFEPRFVHAAALMHLTRQFPDAPTSPVAAAAATARLGDSPSSDASDAETVDPEVFEVADIIANHFAAAATMAGLPGTGNGNPNPAQPAALKIGRASCRERVLVAV